MPFSVTRFVRLINYCVLFLLLPVSLLSARKESGIEIPKGLGPFKFVSDHDYEPQNPGLGKSFAYRSNSGQTATLYIYDLGIKDWGNGVRDERVTEVARMAADEIRQVATSGVYQNLKLADFDLIDVGAVAGWYSKFTFTGKNGREHRSAIFVTGYRKQVVKLRLTGDAVDSLFDGAMEHFLFDLGTKVLKPLPKSKKEETTIELNEVEMQDPYSMPYVVYSLLKQASGGKFSFKDELESRTLMASAWDGLATQDIAANEKRAGLVELDRVYKAGFLKEYCWTFARNYAWKPPAKLRLSEFESWRNKEIPGHVPYRVF